MQSGHVKVERRGIMMLTFMPAMGERKYDHEKRQVEFLIFPPLTILIIICLSIKCSPDSPPFLVILVSLSLSLSHMVSLLLIL